ncbi:MAG: hypothetical protein ABJH63_15370 [Rhizobiaceae bacterium]
MLNRAQLQQYVEISFQLTVSFQSSTDASEIEYGHGIVFPKQSHSKDIHYSIRVTSFRDNREIEPDQLKRFCRSIYPDKIHYAGETSLNDLAEQLLIRLDAQYPKREWEIQVRENGKDGAMLWYFDAV